MLRACFVLVVAIVGVLGTNVAEATLAVALDLRELVTRAERIAIVTPVRAVSTWDDRGRIVTDTVVRIDESMKGDGSAGTELVVRTLGGEIGELGMRVEGEAQLTVGERAILFAANDGALTRWRAVAMAQGWMRIRVESGAELVLPGGDGIALVQRGARGSLLPAPAALLRPRPLNLVRADILALVRQAGRP